MQHALDGPDERLGGGRDPGDAFRDAAERRGREIRERVLALEVVAVDDTPGRPELRCEGVELRAGEWRDAAAARDALLRGEIVGVVHTGAPARTLARAASRGKGSRRLHRPT